MSEPRAGRDFCPMLPSSQLRTHEAPHAGGFALYCLSLLLLPTAHLTAHSAPPECVANADIATAIEVV